ncbi:MAG TPA: arginine--tRNA ligase [Solirubrobacterales bacterium]
MVSYPDNVLDQVFEVLERRGLGDNTRLSVPHHPSRRDLSLFGLRGVGEDSAEKALDEIRSLATIGAVSDSKGDRTSIRFSDDCIEQLGERLESGDLGALSSDGICPDKRVVIDFCDPNASKALHVGHLRNLALGHSSALIARACGATVQTSSQIGDVGRSMAEAIAGYLKYADGEDPEGRGEKSDHLVGKCYSRYVHEDTDAGVSGEAADGDPALSREDLGYHDHAAQILVQLRLADPTIYDLWRKVRDWALDGHNETFERLGIVFDRPFLESEYRSEIESVGDQLVDLGLARTAPNGVVFYDTGDSNYPHLVLRSSDGNSTQHLRYIALWHATRSTMVGEESLQVMGDEWLHIGQYGDLLMKHLSPDNVAHPMDQLLHGMVSVEDAIVKSSGVAPWLIDELLDELMDCPEIAELADGDAELADRMAAITALGFFLSYPPSKPISLSHDALFDPGSNVGWALVMASGKAWDEEFDGLPDPLASDRDYRFVVAQSQVHRQLTRRAFEELNPAHLARLHMHLAGWFLNTSCTPSTARAMRSVTSAGLATLGLGSLKSRRSGVYA